VSKRAVNSSICCWPLFHDDAAALQKLFRSHAEPFIPSHHLRSFNLCRLKMATGWLAQSLTTAVDMSNQQLLMSLSGWPRERIVVSEIKIMFSVQARSPTPPNLQCCSLPHLIPSYRRYTAFLRNTCIFGTVTKRSQMYAYKYCENNREQNNYTWKFECAFGTGDWHRPAEVSRHTKRTMISEWFAQKMKGHLVNSSNMKVKIKLSLCLTKHHVMNV
jgi:hypothetical protein